MPIASATTETDFYANQIKSNLCNIRPWGKIDCHVPWKTLAYTHQKHRDALLFLCRSELLFNCKKDDEDDFVIQAYKAYNSS